MKEDEAKTKRETESETNRKAPSTFASIAQSPSPRTDNTALLQ